MDPDGYRGIRQTERKLFSCRQVFKRMNDQHELFLVMRLPVEGLVDMSCKKLTDLFTVFHVDPRNCEPHIVGTEIFLGGRCLSRQYGVQEQLKTQDILT